MNTTISNTKNLDNLVIDNMRPKSFSDRVRCAVDTIYSMTQNGLNEGVHSNKTISKLYKSTFTLLNKHGFITNHGNKTKPKYRWFGMQPTAALYEMICNELRADNRMHTEKYYPSKQPKKALINTAIVKPTITQMDNSICLDSFTSRQLFDALKARGFVIKDNMLVRTETLS